MRTNNSSVAWQLETSSRNGLRVSPTISPRYQEQITRLGRLSGTEFDRSYMVAMVQNHQENVNVFQTRGRAAQSNDVRQLVNRGIPTLEQHMDMAKRIGRQVGVNAEAALQGRRIAAER